MKKRKILLSLLIMISCFIIGNSYVKAETVPVVTFTDNQVYYGEKIYVNLDNVPSDAYNKKIWGFFASETDPSENGGMFSLELKDATSEHPYFETSSYMQSGHTYVMHSISLGSDTYVCPNNNYNKEFMCNGLNKVTILDSVKIDQFQVTGSKEIVKDGKIKFILRLSGDSAPNVSYVSIQIRNADEKNIVIYGYLSKSTNNEYIFDLSKAQKTSKIIDGQYYVSDIMIFTTKSTVVHYSTDSTGDDVISFFNPDFFKLVTATAKNETTPKKEETKKTEEFLKKVTVKKTSAKINEKVEVDLDTKKNLSSATLIFSNDKESMTVTVKKLNSKDSYFVIPFTTNSGNYTLDFAVLKDIDGKEYQYRKGENYFNIVHFDFNSTLTIDSTFKDGDSLSLDNSKITAEVIKKIKELDSNILLEINANENPLITKEMFEAIKGSNKTIVIKYNDVEWTFNGLDIKNIKPIDVSTNIYNTSKDTDIKSIIKKGLVLDFANNDKLPGKCLIKLYNNEELNTLLKNKNANIYYYNEEKGKFEIVELDSKFNKKGYYEFYISHNSKYLITNETVEDSYVINTNKSKTSNKFSLDLNTILIIGIPSILVIIILIIILIVKSNKKKKQKVTLNNNINNMENTNITNDNNNINNEINNDNNDLSNNIDTSNDNIDQNNINE